MRTEEGERNGMIMHKNEWQKARRSYKGKGYIRTGSELVLKMEGEKKRKA